MSAFKTLFLSLILALGVYADITHHARFDDGGHPHPHNLGNPNRRLLKRSITTDYTMAAGASYDFVIAGGGVAGLALAARLSEWSNITVLLIEAGSDGSEFEDRIDIPGYAYLHGLGGSPYDWNYTTSAQSNANGQTKGWPRGRGLGGSGATNGLFWCRGSQTEYDAWAKLNPDGEQTWDWAEVQKYINKAEGYTDATADVKSEFGMVTDPSVHGRSGPIKIGFSAFIWDAVANWIPTWTSLGMPAQDLAGGDVRGVMMCPSTINVQNGTRSDSKAGYIDPLPPRSNLVILTGYQVTSVIFNGSTDASGNKVVSGVTFQSGRGATSYSVQANNEVILAGGTIGSAQILQLSGVGPDSVLSSLGISNNLDLPVGYNLQDHYSSSVYFNTPASVVTWASLQHNDTLQAEQLQQWREDGTGMWTYINEAIGYTAMSDLLSSSALSTYTAAVQSGLSATIDGVTRAHSLPDNVVKGLTAQYDIMHDWLSDATVGQLELLLTMLGRNGATNQVGIQVALQHPWARGSIFITTTDPFTQPKIDPDYFGVGYDADIMNYGTAFARRLAGTSPLSNVMTAEDSPGTSVTDDSLTNFIKQNGGTEYHPLGTCSMLPRDSGGVVDTNLLVYGSANLRVIDASVMPLQISAHLMASTYGIAEKGADIIKQKYQYVPPPSSSSVSSSTGAAETATAGRATDTAVTNENNKATSSQSALSTGAKLGIGIGAGVGVLALLAALLAFCCVRRKKRAAMDSKGHYVPPVQQDAYANTSAKEMPESMYPMAAFTAPLAPYSHTRSDSMDSMDTTRMAAQTPMRSDSGYGFGAQTPHRDSSSYSLDSQGRVPSGSEYPRHQTYTPVKF